MSTDRNTYGGSADSSKSGGQRFHVVAAIALLSFGAFAFYDGREFYGRYIRRCEDAPNRPECAFLNAGKVKPRPNLGLVIDQDSGKWALQLEATDENTAKEMSTRLWEAGANPRLIKITGRKKTVFYYVQLGRFKTQKEAIGAGAQLKTKGLLQSFVVAEYRQASR